MLWASISFSGSLPTIQACVLGVEDLFKDRSLWCWECHRYVSISISWIISWKTGFLRSERVYTIEYPTSHLNFLGIHRRAFISGNANDIWSIPWYTERDHCTALLNHAMKNTAANTINGSYELRVMGRLDVIPSNIQQRSRILIGFSSYYGIYTNIQDAGNMDSLQHILDKINCETSRLFKSLMTDRVNIKMWTIALTISHILYLIPIFCFAAQNIITQDSIAIRHYWWCKLFCYFSGHFHLYAKVRPTETFRRKRSWRKVLLWVKFTTGQFTIASSTFITF